MKLTAKIAAMVMMAAVLCGCEQKELCMDHMVRQRVRIAFDWHKAPDASPAGMSVYLYSTDGTGSHRFDFNNPDGGYIEVPAGNYHILCYNNDSEVNRFGSTGSYGGHCAFTRDAYLLEGLGTLTQGSAPRASAVADERVVLTPEQLWGSSLEGVTVNYSMVNMVHSSSRTTDADGVQVITLEPEHMTCHYTYTIKNVKNTEHIGQMCATISGMAPGVDISTAGKHTECVTLPIEAVLSAGNEISGEFYTFGHHTDNSSPHIITLYVWLTDGTKWVYGATANPGNMDVTSQVENAPDPRDVHLVIDGLELPRKVDEGGDVKPSIDDWSEVHCDIIM